MDSSLVMREVLGIDKEKVAKKSQTARKGSDGESEDEEDLLGVFTQGEFRGTN